MRKLLIQFSMLLTGMIATGQSSTLFTVPENAEHEGAILKHQDGSSQIETFFKLSRENELQLIETITEVDTNTFILIGKFRSRAAHSLVLFNQTTALFEEIYTFDSSSKIDFSDELYFDKDGNVIGVVLQGDFLDSGYVFSYSFDTKVFSKLVELDKSLGPYISRSFAFNQKSNLLYGLTASGGTGNSGFIFSLNLTSKIISPLFQINLISTKGLFGKHWKYDPQLGLIGYLFSSSNRNVLFRLGTNNIFNVIKDFNTALEKPNGSVCVMDNMLIGTSLDVPNQRQQIFRSDSSGNNRTVVSIHRDSAWGTSTFKSMIPLNDSIALFCSHNGGQYNSGALFTVSINELKLTHLMSFSSSTGYGPERLIPSKNSQKVTIYFSNGSSGKRGSLLAINLKDNSYSQVNLLGMPAGATIGNGIVEVANKKIIYISESGGYFGKGTLGVLDYYSHQVDTVISFGGETYYNDSSYRTPDISSLTAINDTIIAFHFKEGGPNLRGGMALFSTKNLTQFEVTNFSTKENQTPVGRISRSSIGEIFTWTSVDYTSEYKSNLLKISLSQKNTDTLYSLTSPIGFFPFSDRRILIDGPNLFTPYIGYISPFVNQVRSDGVAKFNINEFKYTEFPFYRYGILSGTNLLKVENNKLAFIMTSDADFGFGKLVIYDLSKNSSEIYPFFDLNLTVRPVGGIYYDELDNSIFMITSNYGDYGLGGLMKFDLYSRTFTSLIHFGGNPDFSSIVNYSPQILRVHPYPLGSSFPSTKELGTALVYPNPSSGTFYIKSEHKVDVKIYSSEGKLVRSIFDLSPGTPILLNDVAKGVYFIRINGLTMERLIIR